MIRAVQLPCCSGVAMCSYPCSPLLCLAIGKLHACTRAARSPHGIGSCRTRKAPRYRHACRNAEIKVARRCIMRSPGCASNSLRSVSGSNVGSNSFVRLDSIEQNQQLESITSPVLHFGEGFSRALSHELKHSWKQTRARWCRPIACQIPMVWLNEIQNRGGGRKNALAFPILCARSLSRRPPKNSAASFRKPR